MGLWWRELKGTLWMILFIVLLTAVAVVLVRLLAFPMVVVTVKTMLAALPHMQAGGDLPDLALVASLTALAIYLVSCSVLCIVPFAVVLAKAYAVVRHRIAHKHRWRHYPALWRQLRRATRGVAGITVVVATGSAALYLVAALALSGSPYARVWAPAVLFGPVFGVGLWRPRR